MRTVSEGSGCRSLSWYQAQCRSGASGACRLGVRRPGWLQPIWMPFEIIATCWLLRELARLHSEGGSVTALHALLLTKPLRFKFHPCRQLSKLETFCTRDWHNLFLANVSVLRLHMMNGIEGGCKCMWLQALQKWRCSKQNNSVVNWGSHCTLTPTKVKLVCQGRNVYTKAHPKSQLRN